MNIVFMGTAKFGIPTLEKLSESPHRVMAVVTQPDRPAGRGRQLRTSPVKEVAQAKDLYLYQPDDVNAYEFLRRLRALSPDVVVVVAYGQKLGNDILTLPRFYTVNTHPSLLPRYRGPAPVARALLNGEKHTGVAIIKVVKKMDAGPILGITRVDMPRDATTPEVEDMLANVGADLLLEVLEKIENRSVVEIPQNERESSYARKFEKRDGRIDWRKPGHKIHRFVCALQPFPGAFTFFRRRRLLLYRTRPEKTRDRPRGSCGTITEIARDRFRVLCGDGFLDVLEVKPEGKRRMAVEEFLHGSPLQKGDRLG
ncbi:MAG: methionyl-tRNA formyltransferase [Planctomycetota bacterium]|jgi:methionyl-tRNA formyltransferase